MGFAVSCFKGFTSLELLFLVPLPSVFPHVYSGPRNDPTRRLGQEATLLLGVERLENRTQDCLCHQAFCPHISEGQHNTPCSLELDSGVCGLQCLPFTLVHTLNVSLGPSFLFMNALQQYGKMVDSVGCYGL